MAPNLHFSKQTPHLMHFDWSITCGFLTEPAMHETGQLRAQRVQPTHLSSWMRNFTSFLHLPARHFWPSMCSRYSSMKYRKLDWTGLEAVWPRPQSEARAMASLMFFMSSMSLR